MYVVNFTLRNNCYKLFPRENVSRKNQKSEHKYQTISILLIKKTVQCKK